MRRRRGQGGNVPKWIVTFADLMALLVVFFVMLYSMSVIDAERFEVAAASVREAFGPMVLDAQSVPRPVIMDAEDADTTMDPVHEPLIDINRPSRERVGSISEAQTRTYERLTREFSAEIEEERLEVREGRDRILIRFEQEAAFPSGSADLNEEFIPVLRRLGALIAETPGRVRVSGHTDDVPVRGDRFRSNWELSGARATSVLHILEEIPGIESERLVAQGHAHTQPLVENVSAEARARNRRVEIVLTEFRGEPDDQLPLSFSELASPAGPRWSGSGSAPTVRSP